jgi:hypothetical protein
LVFSLHTLLTMTNNIMVKQSSVKDVCDIVPLHKQFMWSGILKDSNAFKNNESYSPSDMSPYTGTYRKHCCENPKSYETTITWDMAMSTEVGRYQ